MNQIFGRLQHPKNEVRYLENIFFQTSEAFFSYKGVFVTKVIKANIITKILGPDLSVKNIPFKNVSPQTIVQCKAVYSAVLPPSLMVLLKTTRKHVLRTFSLNLNIIAGWTFGQELKDPVEFQFSQQVLQCVPQFLKSNFHFLSFGLF